MDKNKDTITTIIIVLVAIFMAPVMTWIKQWHEYSYIPDAVLIDEKSFRVLRQKGKFMTGDSAYCISLEDWYKNKYHSRTEIKRWERRGANQGAVIGYKND